MGQDTLLPFAPDSCDTVCDPTCLDPECVCGSYSIENHGDFSKGNKSEAMEGWHISGQTCDDQPFFFQRFHWDIDCTDRYGGPPGWCEDAEYVGDYYSDWPIVVNGAVASITDRGSGARIAMRVRNGVRDVIQNTIVDSEKNLDGGLLVDEFINPKWPHLNNYAIAVNVMDSDANGYELISAIKDKEANINILGEEYSGEFLSFLVAPAAALDRV